MHHVTVCQHQQPSSAAINKSTNRMPWAHCLLRRDEECDDKFCYILTGILPPSRVYVPIFHVVVFPLSFVGCRLGIGYQCVGQQEAVRLHSIYIMYCARSLLFNVMSHLVFGRERLFYFTFTSRPAFLSGWPRLTDIGLSFFREPLIFAYLL